jgi:hypothetical protein
MRVLLELEKWEAVRLKSLVVEGMNILEQQGRTQRGIDGYTDHDLKHLGQFLEGISPERPNYVSPIKIK